MVRHFAQPSRLPPLFANPSQPVLLTVVFVAVILDGVDRGSWKGNLVVAIAGIGLV